jgi:hypothetical protein
MTGGGGVCRRDDEGTICKSEEYDKDEYFYPDEIVIFDED